MKEKTENISSRGRYRVSVRCASSRCTDIVPANGKKNSYFLLANSHKRINLSFFFCLALALA